MSNDKPPTLPIDTEDVDTITNTRRITLTRTGVAALFAQSSYDAGEKLLTTNLTRPAREYRPPPVTRTRLTPNSTTSNNTTSTTCRSTNPSVAAQRSSLFRYVIQRSSSFATTAVSQVMSNTRRHTLKQIRSICNQHDKVSSIDIDVEPVASITDCLEAPSIAAVQICRSISMPNTANKYRHHYEQQHVLVKSGGKPI